MLFFHSRPAKRVRLAHKVKALVALASFLSLGALSAFSPNTAAAQTTPPTPLTQVSFTYLSDFSKKEETVFSQYVGPGRAFVSVTASFTGRGYGLGGNGTGPSSRGPSSRAGIAEVADGDAFIVTPIIDPDLNVNYVLHNETGKALSSLTFTLESAPDLYFYNSRTTNGGFLSQIAFSNSAGFFSDGTPTGRREGFRTLTFSGLTFDDPGRPDEVIEDNDFNAFNFSVHIPDGREGQQFAAVISPDDFTPLAFPNAAPEPGTLMLLVPVGIMLGTVTKARRRRRVL